MNLKYGVGLKVRPPLQSLERWKYVGSFALSLNSGRGVMTPPPPAGPPQIVRPGKNNRGLLWLRVSGLRYFLSCYFFYCGVAYGGWPWIFYDNMESNTGPLFGSPGSMFSWEAMGLFCFLYCFGKSLHLLLIKEQ